MAIETESLPALLSESSRTTIWERCIGLIERLNRTHKFSSVTRRLLAVNMIGVTTLAVIIFVWGRNPMALVDAKTDSLMAQGQAIAAVIAESAKTDGLDVFLSDDWPDVERDAQPTFKRSTEVRPASRLALPTEQIGPLLTRAAQKTGVRYRIYDPNGGFLADSDLPTVSNRKGPNAASSTSKEIPSAWAWINSYIDGSNLEDYVDHGRQNGTAYPEVAAVLPATKAKTDGRTSSLRADENNRRIVTVAVPIIRIFEGNSVLLGAVLLSTPPDEIDALVRKERLTVARMMGIALLAFMLSSLFLAATIAWPLRTLARAAERVQQSLREREELPDYSQRTDEIGYLAGTMRNMTEALYRRIEASERFAADVAHELKNPLTSVRSAAETLAIVKTEEERAKLVATMQHDVRRLTRLIDDISKATRVEAEMALEEAAPVSLADLLKTIVGMFNDVHTKNGKKVTLELGAAPDALIVNGHDSRLGQVFVNLLDNALSFSPANGTVRIAAKRTAESIVVTVDDEGPGIASEAFENIFKRFYTDRPGAENFGKNSGLGLSITRDIITGHGGVIMAENLTLGSGPQRKIRGARFTIRLPVAHKARRFRAAGR